MRLLLAFCLLIAGPLLSGTSQVLAANIKLLTTGAVRPAAQDIAIGFEKQSGNKVTIVNDTAGAVLQRIKDGEKFDVVINTQTALDTLSDLGIVTMESVVPLVRVGIGVAVPLSAPQPNLYSVDAFRQTLLAAHAIAYLDPTTGATTGIYLKGLFQSLGIASQVERKAIMVRGGLAAERVARGDADIALQQASEIKVVPSVRFAGLIPEPIQLWTIYSGAVNAKTEQRDAALALLAALSDPGNEPMLKRRGLQLPQ
jgi:molybdate transport system substrate-binding protein